MSFLLRRRLAGLIVLVATLGNATASIDAYLSLRRLGSGDLLVDQVQILSFSKGTESTVNSGSPGSGGEVSSSAAKSAMLGFTPNAAVNEMFVGLASGRPYQLLITLIESSGGGAEDDRVLTEVAFDHVLFSDLQYSAADGEDLVEVEVEFLYGAIYWTEYQIGEEGSNGVMDQIGWSHSLNQEVFTNFFEGDGSGDGGGGGGSGELDTDGDGMPNTWEDANGLNKNLKDGGENLDGDSLTNFQEFVAGTDPQSASSFFRCRIEFDGGVELEWSSLSGRRYRIMHSTSLADGFQLLEEIDASDGSTTSYTPAPASGPFFKIEALLSE
ncbi:hypothetical protein [Haloferula sp.]|uniref:hypothetical protein n=1 Tax=Haloferula sp. TaxID=2497595 RepID=UPI00329D0EBC